jgi:hypothetical protein
MLKKDTLALIPGCGVGLFVYGGGSSGLPPGAGVSGLAVSTNGAHFPVFWFASDGTRNCRIGGFLEGG